MNIKPFKPLLYRADLENVTSPPFDVVTKQQEAVLKQNPYNITHITLPNSGDPGEPDRLIRNWTQEGILAKSDQDSIIILTQDFRGNGKDFCRVGMVVPVETSPPSNTILPHENTFEWAVKDRKELMSGTSCQLEPIFLAVNGVNFERMLKSAIRGLSPSRTIEEPTGVINRFYLVTESSSINSIVKSVSREKAIVADGHHRLKATREIYTESDQKDRDFWKYSLAYVTSLQQESLMISGINRLLSSEYAFRNYEDELRNYFDIVATGKGENQGIITIYDGSFHGLVPKENAFAEIGEFGKFRFKADPSLVNFLIFEKIMGMSLHDIARKVSYTQSIPLAVEEVENGRAGFAILMPEWDKSTFLSMTENGRIMPQKSTYFYPKIPSGIALYCKETA